MVTVIFDLEDWRSVLCRCKIS